MATDAEILEAINEGLLKAATGVQRYRIGQRETQRYSLRELLDAQKDAAWAEARAAGTAPMFVPIRTEPPA
jgi:hypothetical protein